MSDQTPSAILTGANSSDSLFALELDTKQRFDNAISGIQKPIDYPIPDFQKEFNPDGLSQSDLMNPSKTAGTLGEALFSSDPKISAYATDILRQSNNNLPIAKGVGVPDRFSYSKEIDKYLNGDWGYNPYASIQDNEDFNYRYDYMNQNIFERVFKNVGVGLSRFVGSVALKLGQTFGYMGSMIGNGVEEIFDHKNNNFMSDVADNSLSRWFEGLETDMKNSNLLSVFKPQGWEEKGFFNKLRSGAFWTDEVADGAAFMGEMVASMYLTGNLGKIGWVGKLGETEINLAKGFSAAGKFGRYSGKVLDTIIKTGTGSKNLSDVGRWAFSVTSESAFEASGLYHQVKDDLKSRRTRGEGEYANLSDDEIEVIAGDRAAASFKGNLLVLSASNAFENRFIFGPLFKKAGIAGPPEVKGFRRLIGISEDTSTTEALAKASRKEYKYTTWLGKKLDWKNSNSRVNFYGSRALSATAAEGFWEENAQLAIERLASTDQLTFTSFASKLGDQTKAVLKSWTGGPTTDPEAETNIGLGAVIGIGGSSAVGKFAGGNNYEYAPDPNKPGEFLKNDKGEPIRIKVPFSMRGERQTEERNAQQAIQVYERFRKGFLGYQDVYITDPKTNKPILDADGNLQVDPAKAAGLLDGTAKFLSEQIAADKVSDPTFRKELQDKALISYVVAAKMAGVFDRALKRFDNLKHSDADTLRNLGFDPNTTADSVYLKDSIQEFGKLYDENKNAPPAKLKKGDTAYDEEARKDNLFKAKAGIYSATKLIQEFQSKMLDKDFPSVFSPDADATNSDVQLYNSTLYQLYSVMQFGAMAKENGEFYEGFVQSEIKRLNRELNRLDMAIQTQQAIETPPVFATPKIRGLDLGEEAPKEGSYVKPTLEQDSRGFYYAPSKYEGFGNNKKEVQALIDTENKAQKKHAEYSNIRAQRQYIVSKLSNTENGIQNTKDMIAFHEAMQKKDTKEEGQKPQSPPPPAGSAVPPAGNQPAGPANPVVVPTPEELTQKQAIAAQAIVTGLNKMLNSAVDAHNKGLIPDFNTIITFIAENKQKFAKEIDATLVDFAKVNGDQVINQINKGEYKEESTAATEYKKTVEVLDALLETDVEKWIGDPLVDYLNAVGDAIDGYKAPVIELTEAENDAVQAIRALDLSNTSLAKYSSVLVSDNSSAKEKKDALKGISDQLKDPKTTQVVEGILGQEASEAIFFLRYDKPVTVDLATTEQAPVLNPLEELQAKALQAQKDDIEARRHATWGRITPTDNENESETTDENGKRIVGSTDENSPNFIDKLVDIQYDAELAALQPNGQQFTKVFEPAGAYLISEEPNGKWKLYNQNQESLGFTYDTKEEAMKQALAPVSVEEQELLGVEIKVGDRVIVNTKKDGVSTVKELRGDKALLEDGRQVAIANLIHEEPLPSGEPVITQPLIEEKTHAEDVKDETAEQSGVQPPQLPPALPPSLPPRVAENSDGEVVETENFIDTMVNTAKNKGVFIMPQVMPEEIVMEGDQPKIVNGAIQLKTTQGTQQNQAFRQHNILKKMGENTNPVNFWSEDENGKPLYKVRLEVAGDMNQKRYEPWVYNTAEGKTNPNTGELYRYPFIVAMVIDQEGKYVMFDDEGNIADKRTGKPFGFVFTVEDYKAKNLNLSRKGAQTGTGEQLTGGLGYLTEDPLEDLNTAVKKGIPITATIDTVTAGKLSTFNVDNTGQTYAKEPKQRTIKEIEEAGDITNTAAVVLSSGEFEYSSVATPGAPTQQIKVGQAYLVDDKTGMRVPLHGKAIKDLTIDGKPFISDRFKEILHALYTSEDRRFELGEENPSAEQLAMMRRVFEAIRLLVYSRNTPVFLNEAGTTISMLEQRPNPKSLLETEVNFSKGRDIIIDPFDEESEGIPYEDFVKENFLSGVVPVELTKGEKNFEKLNRRVIFTVDKTHQDILNALGAKPSAVKTIQMKMTDFTKFVNKSFKKRGSSAAFTVTGYSGGTFTVAGPKGTSTMTSEEFMKDLKNYEEITLPSPSEEVQQDFEDNAAFTVEKEKELNEKAKTMTKEDINNLNFDDC